ncbi:MAG: DUF4912 domain-containing protein [Treponema sp.]|nr:DUF4912 domain-containing protein [Treponema sp.]
MENSHTLVSRQWLESLSTDELIKLADTNGIDIPPGLERIFIIEELLEVTNAEEQETTDDIKVNPSYSETVLLPKQYNISYIEVIIRDPLWVFTFWEVKGHDRIIHENAADFNGYFLRVIPLDKEGNEPKSMENSFTVSVSAEDSARYLGITEHTSQDSNCYMIKLGVIRGESELHIASSLPFYLPKLSENESLTNLCGNPLIRLSGVQDLSIIKNSDRQSRFKRQQ